MKLHTDVLDAALVSNALFDAKFAYPYHVASDVHFVVFEAAGSRQRSHAFNVQLGTYDKSSGPTNSRHYKNSGQYGADSIYAATYDEWGWFIARIFAADPNAIFGPYAGREDFETKTKRAYLTTSDGAPYSA